MGKCKYCGFDLGEFIDGYCSDEHKMAHINKKYNMGEEGTKVDTLRPSHYKEGEDTFAWAERTFDTDVCLAIAAFNIHKYNTRDKDQDYMDFGKIADYALWARRIMDGKTVS